MNVYREPAEMSKEEKKRATMRIGQGTLLTDNEHCACAPPGFFARLYYGIRENHCWRCDCGKMWKWSGIIWFERRK